MTGGATFLRVDVPVFLQEKTEFFLRGDALTFFVFDVVLGEILLSVVIKIVDFLEWTEVQLRVPVTVETKGHTQTLSMIDLLHVINITMAGLAGHPAVHVSRMVKVNVIRRLGNTHPLQRFLDRTFNRNVIDIDTHGITQQSELWTPLLHVLVTVPTRVGGRNTRTR